MLRTATGILYRIHTFLHGLFFPPPPEDEDEFAFLDDLAWLQETERIRQDALLFWSEASINRYKSLSELSVLSKFYEKHTTALPEMGMINLNALSGIPEKKPRDVIFEPLRPADGIYAADSIPGFSPAVTDQNAGIMEPIRTFVDPLEDLYEPVDTGIRPLRETSTQPYNDLYAVIMRMTTNRKQK